MSKFCRHGALPERCPICHGALEAATRIPTARPRRAATETRPRSNVSSRSRLTVRHEARATDDGFRSGLAPGLRSREDAERLAGEIGFATGRLAVLESDPPGLYAQIAAEPDLEQASWLAFLTAYLGPLEEAAPFAEIAAAATPWDALPDLATTRIGPRGSHEAARGDSTLLAYRRFAERAGSQRDAIGADPAWTPEQRFERIFERLNLPGLHRPARYDLLVTLGRLGRYALAAPGLLLTEHDAVMLAAKRVFGIGDRLTLERRARELAGAAGVPVESLDLALENWARGERITQGVPDAADSSAEARAGTALGL